jgi:hypothetical protein
VSLLNRLRGGTPDVGNVAHPKRIQATLYTGSETLEVVGESNYQDALWKIVGGRRDEPVRFAARAVLLPEPDNRYDSNAIKVLIDGNLVGYLSRDDAAAYHPGLLRLMNGSANQVVALEAEIVGGGQRSDRIGFLGVFLDHDRADFGLNPRHPAAAIGFRTGLSEAATTDPEDDRYDLSWRAELPNTETTAIKRLRTMLESHDAPIERHYMMCELEERLYKGRDSFSSALEEFDAVCRQHDAEMETIRPALLDKFGKIPLIDLYRQAAVRCQKAKDWTTMRQWAERGITVYGDHAARPEDLADLHKRLDYANAKIEAANRPTPPKQRQLTH